MIRRIQALPKPLRVLTFSAIIAAALFAIYLVTLGVISAVARSQPRTVAVASDPALNVSEFAVLPDEDAYPSSLAMAQDGSVYTASYASGTIWRISPDGEPTELPGTRDQLGAVIALELAPDGTLYALDHTDPLNVQGGIIWQLTPDGELSRRLTLDAAPASVAAFYDDLAVDAVGNLYISDRVQDRVYRLAVDDEQVTAWWQEFPTMPDEALSPGGLGYDPVTDSIIVADATAHRIYRVPVTAEDPTAATEILFEYEGQGIGPGFDGLTVTPDGVIYLAALGQNAVARLEGTVLDYLARGFRGASDVAFDAARNRLIVTNWDQSYLRPATVWLVFTVDSPPRLPFALDAIDLP